MWDPHHLDVEKGMGNEVACKIHATLLLLSLLTVGGEPPREKKTNQDGMWYARHLTLSKGEK